MGKAARNKKIRRINDKMPKIKIDLNTCPFYKCPKCEKEVFDRIEIIKVISKILTGQPSNSYVAQIMYRCVGCEHVIVDGPVPPIG